MGLDDSGLLLFFGGLLATFYTFFHRRFLQDAIRRQLLQRASASRRVKQKTPLLSDLLLQSLKKRLLGLAPRSWLERFERMLRRAGYRWGTGDVIFLKGLLTLVGFSLALLLAPDSWRLALRGAVAVLAAAAAFMLPDFFLIRQAQLRQRQIRQSLPSFIDNLITCVEAGLGLDLALNRVVQLMGGPLSDEVSGALTEIRYGKARRDAFRSLSERVNLPELSAFLTALVNGEQLGMSIGAILRVQGQQIRERRKLQIREEAYKIPVKLLFPLVLFIFPVLFLVLLGPAAIKVSESMFR
ncbi:hypothetical protein GTO89_05415 [Heliobacterium gestii]|uniref:Type II secretion system protein GspF domain-containing protein n=1 Tax=Heliomicrobium gestii TaxID=2699 RepID=A0A845L8D6_HELGE|nr:type II secretion system F family protein [Heliomicrobium gestii]MBM7866196.1 tight adherence protein C [Heliomicrobium gestii]MZP42478.1 hypothetical protein [Heliomicrobium gestii]